MNTSVQQLATTTQINPSDAPRYSIYTGVHKGLRALMCDTLMRVSSMDLHDADEVTEALEQLRLLLNLCRTHLHHENQFMHPALEQAKPNSAMHTADDHVQHEQEIDALSKMIETLEQSTGTARLHAAHQLYLQVALFVGENFVHMNVEETANQAVLIEAYSDAELLALEGRIVAHIPPAEGAQFRRWIIPSVNATERLRLFKNAREHAPPQVFAGFLQLARSVLSEREWFKLERGLQ